MARARAETRPRAGRRRARGGARGWLGFPVVLTWLLSVSVEENACLYVTLRAEGASSYFTSSHADASQLAAPTPRRDARALADRPQHRGPAELGVGELHE